MPSLLYINLDSASPPFFIGKVIRNEVLDCQINKQGATYAFNNKFCLVTLEGISCSKQADFVQKALMPPPTPEKIEYFHRFEKLPAPT